MLARPPLPLRFANPNLRDYTFATQLPPVKYQILNCQGKDILVGRLKIDTPTETGHAFILRRFDTGAVSLTTMFRAAFPTASDTDEKAEINWVRETYDLSGNNGSTRDPHITRLAGTWVSPQIALELGKEYDLGDLIKAVVQATPDPNGNYRRSGKAAPSPSYPPNPPAYTVNTGVPPPTVSTVTTTTTTALASTVVVTKPPSAVKSLPTPSPTSAAPPSKRRKESSPAPAPTPRSSKPPSRASPAPTKTPVRRSTRTKSPAPHSSVVVPLTSVSRTPKVTRSVKKESQASTSLTPGSDLTAVDEESQSVEDGIAGAELREEDIKEQQRLIQDLKVKREEERLAAEAAAGQDNEEVKMEVAEESSSKKREREEEETPLQFDFKEPEAEQRVIATNSRVGRIQLEPRAKSFVWGVAAFAVGMGAV
ncbi:hypothetical protein CPC08DRAFT_630178 [Agrocybe pediades]|nr:hypothetical protein CPC08DRAFT_630178 [Agrocybe pediades]